MHSLINYHPNVSRKQPFFYARLNQSQFNFNQFTKTIDVSKFCKLAVRSIIEGTNDKLVAANASFVIHIYIQQQENTNVYFQQFIVNCVYFNFWCI